MKNKFTAIIAAALGAMGAGGFWLFKNDSKPQQNEDLAANTILVERAERVLASSNQSTAPAKNSAKEDINVNAMTPEEMFGYKSFLGDGKISDAEADKFYQRLCYVHRDLEDEMQELRHKLPSDGIPVTAVQAYIELSTKVIDFEKNFTGYWRVQKESGKYSAEDFVRQSSAEISALRAYSKEFLESYRVLVDVVSFTKEENLMMVAKIRGAYGASYSPTGIGGPDVVSSLKYVVFADGSAWLSRMTLLDTFKGDTITR